MSDVPVPPTLRRLNATSGERRLTYNAGERLIGAGTIRRRPPPTAARIAWRRRMVWLTKWLLPLMALLLLTAIAAWPELSRVREQGRVALRRVLAVDPESGRMMQPHYRGVDQRNRPYTVTASTALQTSAERVALSDPKGDVVTESGTWVMVQAQDGVFIQHQSVLDLQHEVVLYREDGTRLSTDTATMDLKQGVATSSDQTHAEGPFGVLDSQGFALADKGADIQFSGPSHLVMNEGDKK